ncbi:nuclear receptor-interacting protein 2 isoform B [Patagioenas fasciata monilis]|uniref:Nuclear receptor-interacting protein 2 isoform B n=1 Tax=Patagioenas fasciata monilis TaxID=372326 RepID=A0A1V4JAH9_PATFA|nr:nuclear receptor-interacting protein 2 isoform B [Patagioenas fasciata monilis]
MSTRKSFPLLLGKGDQEEKQSEGTPDLEQQECEVELRSKAVLHQKRRLKQTIQFVHKDSADLLPLDGLTRLGTSKDLCQGQALKATVNTGCLPNLISRSCLNQLGLEEVSAMDSGDLSLPIPSVVGRVEHMELQFGQETVLCSALVVDDEMLEFCIGLQTLLSLKCCIDLEEGVLRFKALSQELPFLHASEEPGQ